MGLGRARKVFNNDDFQYVLEVDFQLDSFREYLKLTEKVINNEIKDKIEKYNKFLEEAPDFVIEMEHDFEDHEIKIHTQQLYYNSLFISMYSFLEKKMFQLCKLAEDKNIINVNDLSGDGIFKYYKYFKKVLLINLDEINTEWTEINKYNKLRNHFVHSPENILERSNNNLKKIGVLKSIRNISIIEKDHHIEFGISDKQLLLDFLKIIDRFLDKIYYERI